MDIYSSFCDCSSVSSYDFRRQGRAIIMAAPDKNHKLKKKLSVLLLVSIIYNVLNTEYLRFLFYIYIYIFMLPPLGLCCPGRPRYSSTPHPPSCYTPAVVSKHATVTVIPSCPRYSFLQFHSGRSERPGGLKRRSAVARPLGLRVRISPGAWISVSCQCLCCQV